MTRGFATRPSKRLLWASGLMLIAAGCANPAAMPEAPAAGPPVPAGQARIWFFREWEPSESLNLANIDVNGSYFGSVANGGVFYRDVSPGHYHIAPRAMAKTSIKTRMSTSFRGNRCTAALCRCAVGKRAAMWRSLSGTRSTSGWCRPRWHRPQSSGTAAASEVLVCDKRRP